jgi:hypothetical protein
METLQRTANRGSVSTGYDIDNSVKLETTNNEWLYRASPTAGNRRTFTFSFWIKRSTLGNPTASGVMYVAGQGQHGRMYFTSDYFGFRFDDGHDTRDITTLHRDTAAWLHVVVAVDTNQSSSSNRVKIYFNGVQTTNIDFDGGSYPDLQDQASGWFTTNYLTVGTAPFGGSYNAGDGDYDMSGYLAEFCAVDGQQLAPTDFGEFDEDSGIWKPIDVSGINFGSQGYYLDFADASDLGDDESGNGNDFTENNLAAADQATDTPTNIFCIWNPIPYYNTNYSFANGATEVVRASGTGWTTALSSMAVNKGKWYAEFQVLTSGNYLMNGQVPLAKVQSVYATQFYLGSEASAAAGAGYYSSGTTGNDAIYHDGGFTSSGVTTSANDIISVAMDCDNNKVHFAVNGSYTNSSDPANNTNGFTMTDDYQFFAHSTLTGDQVFKNNFGGFTTISISSAASDANGYGTFEYAPPSGFYALNTKNLAEYG